jgi:hypothetical protein
MFSTNYPSDSLDATMSFKLCGRWVIDLGCRFSTLNRLECLFLNHRFPPTATRRELEPLIPGGHEPVGNPACSGDLAVLHIHQVSTCTECALG